jgi:protein-tyrosine-phosphatase
MSQVVVFVCPHGALKSRLAAAFFNAAARPGWRAVSAGLEPQADPSVHAAALVAGTARSGVAGVGSAARFVHCGQP